MVLGVPKFGFDPGGTKNCAGTVTPAGGVKAGQAAWPRWMATEVASLYRVGTAPQLKLATNTKCDGSFDYRGTVCVLHGSVELSEAGGGLRKRLAYATEELIRNNGNNGTDEEAMDRTYKLVQD